MPADCRLHANILLAVVRLVSGNLFSQWIWHPRVKFPRQFGIPLGNIALIWILYRELCTLTPNSLRESYACTPIIFLENHDCVPMAVWRIIRKFAPSSNTTLMKKQQTVWVILIKKYTRAVITTCFLYEYSMSHQPSIEPYPGSQWINSTLQMILMMIYVNQTSYWIGRWM